MPRIAELITQQSGHLRPDTTLGEAAATMLKEKLSSVIIVGPEGILGIATEGDILHAMREHRALEQAISSIMTTPVHSVVDTTELRAAYREAANLGIRHIVVTDAGGQPLGVASESDFRRHLGTDFYRHLNNVDTLMERMFPRLPPDASLDAALTAMEAARASCAVVVDQHKAIGILTERDVVRLFLNAEDNDPAADHDRRGTLAGRGDPDDELASHPASGRGQRQRPCGWPALRTHPDAPARARPGR